MDESLAHNTKYREVSQNISTGHTSTTWQMVDPVIEHESMSYELMSRTRPSSAPIEDPDRHNRNIFAAAIDPVTLLSKSTMAQSIASEARLFESSQGPLASISDVGNVHLVLKPGGGMHSLQLTSTVSHGTSTKVRLALTRPVSATGHLPMLSIVQTQLSKHDIIDESFPTNKTCGTLGSSTSGATHCIGDLKSNLVKRLKEKINDFKDIELLKHGATILQPISAQRANLTLGTFEIGFLFTAF